MLFSVVIPTYNRRKLLELAINSVLRQSLRDFEIIVVDDGSTDGTWEYLQTLGGTVVALRQDNKGPGPARNLAARAARGKYLAFLDSDDTWFPWALAVHASCIHRFENPLILSGTHTRYPGELAELSSPVAQRHNCLLDACVGPTPPVDGPPSVTIDRDAFLKIGGFVDERVNGEDVDLWLRAGVLPGFVKISSPPVFTQTYQSDSQNRCAAAQYRGIKYILNQERTSAYPGGLTHAKQRRRIISAMCRGISVDLLRDRRRSDAIDVYLCGLGSQLKEMRWKYIFGFPMALLLKNFIGGRT